MQFFSNFSLIMTFLLSLFWIWNYLRTSWWWWCQPTNSTIIKTTGVWRHDIMTTRRHDITTRWSNLRFIGLFPQNALVKYIGVLQTPIKTSLTKSFSLATRVTCETTTYWPLSYCVTNYNLNHRQSIWIKILVKLKSCGTSIMWNYLYSWKVSSTTDFTLKDKMHFNF